MSDKTILGSAISFIHSCKILEERMNNAINTNNKTDLSLIAPIAVNASFACELLIKSMLNNNVNKHDLDFLFKKLELKIQQEVKDSLKKEIINKQQNYSDSDFLQFLSNNKDTFCNWRYFYEGKTNKVDIQFLLSFMDSLFNVAKKYL